MLQLTSKSRPVSPPLKAQSAARRSQLRWLIVLAALWLLLAIVYANKQSIIDWWRLRNYQAPAAVAGIADQDTMTAYARKVFYVNQPDITDKTTFRERCPAAGDEKTIVLGCYHGAQSGIYLLRVTDSRLNGVEQVTAAHEMLHAAYDRLKGAERKRVDGWLQDFYRHNLQDQRLKDTIEAYRQSEPNDLVNEMHSIFGTEVGDLPPALESYYQQYFTNRRQVVGFAARYQSEFTSRKQRIAALDAEIKQLEVQIIGLGSQLQSQQAAIDERRNQLLQQRDSGDVGSYNAGVAAYNQLIDDYNSGVARYQQLYGRYKLLIDQRNAIAGEINVLGTELNAQELAPIKK